MEPVEAGMDRETDLWIVTPVYFDVESFVILRRNVASVLRESRVSGCVRFVVIDDSAGADTEIAALRSLDDVEVITPPYGLGHQRAIVFALRAFAPRIRDDAYIVTMDADGEDRPEDIPRLLEQLTANLNVRTVVVARRTSRHVSVLFRLAYVVFRSVFRVLVGSVIDSGNFAAYRGWVARRVLFHPTFDLCYSSSLLSLQLPEVRVRCARGRRYAGHSRMTYSRLALHGLRMLLPFLDRIILRALVLFTAIFVVTLGALVGCAVAALSGARVDAVVLYGLGVIALITLAIPIVLLGLLATQRSVGLGMADELTAAAEVRPY